MRIALAQMDIKWEDKKQNKVKAKKMLELAGEKKADLIIFPEMTLTGFSFEVEKFGEKIEKNFENSETVSFFKELSIKNNINVCFGMIGEDKEKGYFNKCIVIQKNGNIIADYSKMHPFSFSGEDNFFKKGEEKKIYSLEKFNISPFVCYDLRFPEIFRKDCEKVEIVTVIANWPESRKEHWINLLKARAIENQCFVIGVNRVGEGNGLKYSGNSMAFDYDGNLILDCNNKEGVYFCELNKEKLYAYREGFPVLKDKRFL